MTNYIIDPAWVYWANVCDAIKTIFVVIAVLSVFTIAIPLFCVFLEKVMGDAAQDYAIIGKICRFTIPIMLFATAAAIFIPDATTLIEMKVTELVTRNNIELSGDAIKSVVDYIVDAIKSLK